MTSPSRTRRVTHQTTHAEFYKLCEWCKTADFAGAFTFAAASERASKAMGFAVSTFTVQNALQTVGVTLPTPPATSSGRATTVLARELVALMTELGRAVPEDLRNLAKGRA